jgi:flagellar basal-body rod modification protein FlgD
MSVTSVTSASSATANSPATSSASLTAGARTAKKVLGQEDFMKLLATQFRMQDPLKPMEDTAFIAQMAQFSSLEQSSTMAREMARLRTDQSMLMANGYLGRNVTVEDAQGHPVTGVVTAVENDATAGASLTIGGATYPVSSVRRIEAAAAPAGNPSAPAA